MEENQNVNANPQKKKKGKAKKIVIALIVLLVVAIGVVAVLGFTGKLDFNFTKKSKADAGIEKLGDVVSQTVTDFETEYNEAGLNPKVLGKEDVKSAEASSKVSFAINELEVEDMSSDEEEIMDMVKDMLDKVEFEFAIKTSQDKGNIKVGATIAEEPISVELAYDGEKIGVRSEELNEKWVAVDLKKVIDEVAEEINFDEETMAEIEEMLTKYIELVEDVMLTDKEIEHFKSTYANILTDYILSLDIESEKDKIEVGDKEKSCTKTTISLDEDDIKNLLVSIVEKVEDDTEGQKIVKEKLNLVFDFLIENSEMFEAMDTYSTTPDYDDYDYYYDDYYTNTYSAVEELEDAKEMIDELFVTENFDMIKEAIEEIDLEGLEITIESFASLTEVYATNIIFSVDGQSIIIEMVFDGNKTNAALGMKASGMSMDIAEVVLVNEKNHKSFEINAAKDMKSYVGDMSLKGDVELGKNKITTSIDLNVGEEGNFSFTQETNVKTNTDTEYKATTKVDVEVDVPEFVKFDFTINVEYGLKVNDVKFDSIDEYIDLTDAILEGEPDEKTMNELKQYVLDAVPGVVNVLEAVKTFEIVEQENLEEDIDEAINMLESLSMEDFEVTEELPIETNPDFGTGTVTY